ncbi:hypothetical protein BJP26_14805 [Sphingomonas melonis TY]|nr:hypothetical protein BJP26_14805 [Sphingomonas melonis TY]
MDERDRDPPEAPSRAHESLQPDVVLVIVFRKVGKGARGKTNDQEGGRDATGCDVLDVVTLERRCDAVSVGDRRLGKPGMLKDRKILPPHVWTTHHGPAVTACIQRLLDQALAVAMQPSPTVIRIDESTQVSPDLPSMRPAR